MKWKRLTLKLEIEEQDNILAHDWDHVQCYTSQIVISMESEKFLSHEVGKLFEYLYTQKENILKDLVGD